MRIKKCAQVVSGARHIQTPQEGAVMYILGDYTYFNNKPIFQGFLRAYPSLNDEIYLESFDPSVIYKLDMPDNLLSIRMSIPEGCIRLGHSNKWFVYWDYQNEKSIYTCIKDGESVWTIVCEYAKLIQIQGFGILYDSIGETKGHCQLIDLSTGAVVWELDHPGARVSGVYPYEDKVVIVWFPPMGEEDKSRVLCVEVPSGTVLWENDAARKYQKYGDDKLVFFCSSLWEDGYERGDNHELAELDVRTGAFQTYKFPGYNTSTYVTTVYKDYLFYGTLNYYFYVGAIDLRTHEMLPEVKIDYTPGDFNQIASIGVHDGQLYVEIQTELDHSDIHVLDLDEDE